jgi:membrane-bound lytic murein transglycosylase D
MARCYLPGLRAWLIVALTGLTWVSSPGARAADAPPYTGPELPPPALCGPVLSPLAPLGPEVPVFTPADSLALLVDIPGKLSQATAELGRCQRLLRGSRTMEAQWAAEALLTSLHSLRQKAPMTYAQNQQFVKLVQQAGGIRLRCVRNHLALRPSFAPGAGPDDQDDADTAATAATAPDSLPALTLRPVMNVAASRMRSPSDSLLRTADVRLIRTEDNDRVQHWIDFFTGRGRSTFQTWLTRSGSYLDMMLPVLEKNGLPPDLIHLVFIESGFSPKALSSSAASGPWQFMRSTAQVFGLNVNQQVDERRDPKRSTEAAAQYLKHLYSLFHDWPLALAAYNSGEGTVLRALSRQNTFDYWSLRLPRQTEDYVPEFMAAMTIARNPSAYGFEGKALNPPLSFDEISVPGGVNLGVLSYLSSAPMEGLRRLNPAYLRKQASPKNGAVTVRVPKGTGPLVLARLEQRDYPPALAKPEPEVMRHRVRKGETLAGIARHYGVPVKTLARENHIRNVASRLRVGGVLRVPATEAPDAVPAGARPAGPPPPAQPAVTAGPPLPASPAVAAGNAPAPRAHLVRKGDSLFSIAREHHCTVADLRRWNGLEPDAKLHPGQRLVVAGP